MSATPNKKQRLLILHSGAWLGLAVVLLISACRTNWSSSVAEGFRYLATYACIGWCQYVLLQVMHEAIHQTFLRGSGWRSALTACLNSFPIGLTRKYGILHQEHHRYFGDPARDPDFASYGFFPRSKRDFMATCLRHLTGISAIHQVLSWRTDRELNGDAFALDKFGVLAAQATLFSICVLNGSWLTYFTHWALPLVSLVKLFGFIRILAEHGDLERGTVLRSFRGRKITCWMLAPYGFQYHAEHHLYPSVPYSELDRKLQVPHRRQIEFLIFEGSHIGFLLQTLKRLPVITPVQKDAA